MSLMIAGTSSGSGKSTVTLGILAALKKQGLRVQPFKAGPDFIDPGLHTYVTGRASRNLDLWMCGEDYVRGCLARHSDGAEAVVIEGVMGLYDGGDRSSAALAETLGAKVVLVVDAYGMAESAGALIKGFNDYGPGIDCVIFNRVGSVRHYDRLRDAVPEGVEALGYLPRDASYAIPERHLGLTTAEEAPIGREFMDSIADAISEHVDIKRIAEMARPEIASEDNAVKDTAPFVRLAVARDRAFCFYYEDNLDMLRQAGAELVFFSPLEDKSLPDGIDGILLGGGYPEVHAGTLSANAGMLESIRAWVLAEKPLYAECGGLVYLAESIEADGQTYRMAGALPLKCEMLERRAALGYREVKLDNDCVLGPSGAGLRGHEFHYSRIAEHREADGLSYNVMGEGAWPLSTGSQPTSTGSHAPITSVMYKKTLASYTHLHLGSRPGAAGHLVNFIKGDMR